jgi:cytochrome P450
MYVGPQRVEQFIDFQQELNARIKELFSNRGNGKEKAAPSTVFEVLLHSKLPANELTEERLQHEAVSIIGAAFDTTRQALTTTCFHIIDNPSVYQRLHQELEEAIPDVENIPAWEKLQQLPYLAACIEEGM